MVVCAVASVIWLRPTTAAPNVERSSPEPSSAERSSKAVLVVIDGLRWQEVFTGADSTLVAAAAPDVRRDFWRPTPTARREALMPFLWRTVAAEGSLFGNRAKGSVVRVANGRNVSYPGYDEILTGRVDPRIRDNRAGANRNETVFDWLNAKLAFAGHVAAYGTWQTFDEIFNRERAAFVLRAGWRIPYDPPRTPAQVAIDQLYRGRRRFRDVAPDTLLQRVVLTDLPTIEPRALFVGYGETDEWAHDGRYGEVLRAAHTADSLVAELWSALQASAEYHGVTTLIITTDHGRGATASTWRKHDDRTRGSDETWLAIIRPDIQRLGEVGNGAPITASQIAATFAAAVGETYESSGAEIASPIDLRRRP